MILPIENLPTAADTSSTSAVNLESAFVLVTDFPSMSATPTWSFQSHKVHQCQS